MQLFWVEKQVFGLFQSQCSCTIAACEQHEILAGERLLSLRRKHGLELGKTIRKGQALAKERIGHIGTSRGILTPAFVVDECAGRVSSPVLED
jgi:hypothetical protein